MAGVMVLSSRGIMYLMLLSLVASGLAQDTQETNNNKPGKVPVLIPTKITRAFGSIVRAAPIKIRAVTVNYPPYMNISTDGDGKQTFTGFLPDLLDGLDMLMNTKTEFYEMPGGQWGSIQPSQSWTGMMGEVINRTNLNEIKDLGTDNPGADFAAAPMTISSIRHRFVQFVHPFQHLGLTVVVKKAYMQENFTDTVAFNTHSVLRPFSGAVWGVVAVAAIMVALFMWLLNHFNPYEWGGRYNLGLVTEQHKESFNLSGSLWFVFTTLQWQGFERAPRSFAGKTLTCFWFVFVTLTLVSYTGALINQLWWSSMTKTHAPLTKHKFYDLRDLVQDSGHEFKYGIIKGTSAHRYITTNTERKAMYGMMTKYWASTDGADQLVRSREEGFKRVRNEKFAFILDEMQAELALHTSPCDLAKVGEPFGSTSFGFPFPIGSPYSAAFELAFLQMKENGIVEQLEDKWWRADDACWAVNSVERIAHKAQGLYVDSAQPKSVDISMFMGPIVVMIVGVVLCMVIGVSEVLYYRYKGRYETQNRPQGQTLKLDNDDGNI